MRQRSPLAVLLLPIVTFGIYSWYWLVKTKGEMNSRGQDIPTAWIWLIPFVGSIWWLWKYSEGVDNVTNEKISGVLAFIMLFLLGNIGQAIIQDTFNKLTPVQVASGIPPFQSPENQPQQYSQPTEQLNVEPVAEAPVEVAAEAVPPVAPEEPPVD